MPCTPFRIDGATGIVCTRGRRREPKKCCQCSSPASYECDWKMPDGKTCDRPLCERCTTQPAVKKDLCPEHARAWAEHPTNKQGALL